MRRVRLYLFCCCFSAALLRAQQQPVNSPEWLSPAVLANLIVAGVAIWYTIETQKLRKTAVKQLELGAKQFDIAVQQLAQGAKQIELTRQAMYGQLLPFILAGIHRLSTATHLDREAIQKQLSTWIVRRIELPAVGARPITYSATEDEIFEVASASDEIASHVFCFLFDDRIRAFRIAPYQLEVVAPHEAGYLPIANERFTSEEVLELVHKLYESRGEYIHPFVKAISHRHESVLITIFYDLAGRLYATPRPVYWTRDGTASYGKSDLLSPPTYSDVFAPPFETTAEKLMRPSS